MNGAGEEGEGGDVGKHFTVSWSLLNAHCPISITLWGIVTEVNARQSPNAIAPIRVTPSCMVTEVKALQPKNAKPPISVTFLGIVMEIKAVQKWYLLLVDYQCYTL